VRWPRRHFTVVVLTNRDAPEPYALALRIARLYLPDADAQHAAGSATGPDPNLRPLPERNSDGAAGRPRSPVRAAAGRLNAAATAARAAAEGRGDDPAERAQQILQPRTRHSCSRIWQQRHAVAPALD
jgi:hypothetical protein